MTLSLHAITGNAKLATFDDSGAAAGAAGGDYFTAAEMAAFSKPKKKKEKKERRIRARSVEPEPEGWVVRVQEPHGQGNRMHGPRAHVWGGVN